MSRKFVPIPPLTERNLQLFWAKVDKTPGLGPNGECWEWAGSRVPQGYGLVGFQGYSTFRAHRVAWFIATGQDPAELFVLHRCDNPPCVRCLFIGTGSDNRKDAVAKGRSNIDSARARFVEVRKAQTHCKRGHEFTEANTYYRSSGRRTCRACMNQHQKNYLERKKAKAKAEE